MKVFIAAVLSSMLPAVLASAQTASPALDKANLQSTQSTRIEIPYQSLPANGDTILRAEMEIHLLGGKDVNCSAPSLIAELNTYCGSYLFGHAKVPLYTLGNCRFSSVNPSNPAFTRIQVPYFTHAGRCVQKLAINGELPKSDPWLIDPQNGTHDFQFQLFPGK